MSFRSGESKKESELDEWLAFMDQTPEMTDEIRAFIAKECQELTRRFLSWLWLLYAVPGRYHDQPVCTYVSHAPPCAVSQLADRGNAGRNEEDRGLLRVWRLQKEVSV